MMLQWKLPGEDMNYITMAVVIWQITIPRSFWIKAVRRICWLNFFQYPNNGHSIDRDFIPWQIRGPQGYSGRANPTLDFVEMFDDIDGNPFVLNTGTDDTPVLYSDRMDIFAKSRTTLESIGYFSGDEFKG